MSEALFPYYEGELLFIRELARDFAQQYPAAAGRLMLEAGRSVDPHVERLIEAFALLTARVRNKLDDEFPELTDALFSVLYPHYLAPIPSMALLQFDLDQARAKPAGGIAIPPGSMLHTQRVGDIHCKYRTCYPVMLWPVSLVDAKLQVPPFPQGMNAPARAVAALRLRFEAPAEMPFAKQSLQNLRLYLHGDVALTSALYELIFNHTMQVVFRPMDGKPPPAPITLDPQSCIAPVGFEADEGLLPYPPQAFRGYRLLTEFFAFPYKFHFVDLGGWDKVRQAGAQRQVEVVLFLNRSHNRLEQLLDASMFRLGCTPVANLFPHTAEPMPLSQFKYEYKIVPAVAQPVGYEVHSVESVTGTSPAGDREYRPFYSFRHGGDRNNRQAFWYASRRPSLREADRGSDVYLNLVDLAFDPHTPADSVLVVRTLCSNRDLPQKLPRNGEEVRFEAEFAAPVTRIRCLRNPTLALRPPPQRRGAWWRLVSHLNLNHLSLTNTQEGLPALQEMLRLYDFTDPRLDAQASAVIRQWIDGIVGLSSRRVVARTGGPTSSGFCRGIEVRLEFDEQKYAGTSVYLFASVLERFFALYVTMNSFSQLAARNMQGESDFKRWPPRAGEQTVM
jgi:type VI secretion system protein ImpG